MVEIDEFDVKLLNCLQGNNKMTSDALAETVGLSSTACQRRIKRLREGGVIVDDIAVLSPEVGGGRITLIVQVLLQRGRSDIIDTFKREVRTIPEVQQCYYVTGDYDFTLIVTAKDMADYETLTRRIFFDNPNIQRFHTSVVMENVKVGLRFPL